MFSGQFFRQGTGHRARALSVLAGTLFGMLALAASGAAFAQCTGPGAPGKGSPWQCLTAIQVPGNPLTSFDIGWVNPNRAEYYLADRSNAAVDIVDTSTNKFKKQIGGFVGAKLGNATANTLNNNISGPDGLVSFGKWLYVGDGNSTLKIIDLDKGQIVQSVPTGGSTRVDEMAITGIMSNGQQWLLAANNAEDPPFATLFLANGNNFNNHIAIFTRITVDPSIMPPGAGLSMEQPAWDGRSKRFYVSIPSINYPAGCTPNPASVTGTNISSAPAGSVICQGGLLVIDPSGVMAPNCTRCWQHPGARQRVPIHLRRLRPHKECRRAGAPDLQSQRRRCRPPDRYDRVEYHVGLHRWQQCQQREPVGLQYSDDELH